MVLKGHSPLVLLAVLVLAGAAKAAVVEHPVKEHVDLTLVKKTGSTKLEHRGRATGTISGTVRSKITIKNSVILRGTVTIVTSSGNIRMRVDGRARSITASTRFDGTAVLAGGTGKYAKAVGSGKFHGLVDRRTWRVTLDATGSYHY